MHIKFDGDHINGILHFFRRKNNFKTVKISASDEGGNSYMNVFDGVPGTEYWSGKNDTYGQWVSIAFENNILLTSYSLYSQTGSNCYPKSFEVQSSIDGENWIKIDEYINYKILQPNSFVNLKIKQPIVSKANG